jgi:hypothetical protein
MISRTKLLRAAALLLAAGAFALAAPTPAQAQVDIDLRAGVYTDAQEGFVGGGILTHLTDRWYFNPNVEYVFVDPGSLWTLNGDFHYDFLQSGNWNVWAGAGPALLFRDFGNDRPRRRDDDSETDFGANLLAGVGMVRGPVRPFGQVKVVLSDETEAVLAVGVRF